MNISTLETTHSVGYRNSLVSCEWAQRPCQVETRGCDHDYDLMKRERRMLIARFSVSLCKKMYLFILVDGAKIR